MVITVLCQGCGHSLRVPDSAAGKRVRCDKCQSVTPVPAVSVTDLTPRLATPPDTPAAVLLSPRPDAMREFALACLRSVPHAWRNSRSAILLAIVVMVPTIIMGFVATILSGVVMAAGLPRSLLAPVGLAQLALYCLLGGMVWQYLLRYARGGIANSPERPKVSFEFLNAFLLGLKSLGLLVVYVLPVITIPLYPLATLMFARTEDSRAFDPRWAVRAAYRRPLPFLLPWGMILGWLIVIAIVGAVVVAVGYLAVFLTTMSNLGLAMDILAALLGLALMASVVLFGLTAVMVPARCAGLLGHFFPDLLQAIPARANSAASTVSLTGGVVVSVLVLIFLLPALGGLTAGMSRQNASVSPTDPNERIFTTVTSRWTYSTLPSKSLTDKEIHQDLQRLREDAIRYKKAHGQYPDSTWTLADWLKEPLHDPTRRYPNGKGMYEFMTLPAMAAEVEPVSPYLLIYCDLQNSRSECLAITDTGKLVQDQAGQLRERARNERLNAYAAMAQTEPPPPDEPIGMNLTDEQLRYMRETWLRESLQNLQQDANHYKDVKGYYPDTTVALADWLRKQGVDVGERYPHFDIARYTFTATAALPEKPILHSYLLILAPQNIVPDGMGRGISDTGEYVTDTPDMIQLRIKNDLAKARGISTTVPAGLTDKQPL